MVVDTGTAILILGAFVLPGFITLTLRERLYIVHAEETPFERLLSALLYSAIIYGVLLVAAHRIGLQKSDLVEFQDGGNHPGGCHRGGSGHGRFGWLGVQRRTALLRHGTSCSTSRDRAW